MDLKRTVLGALAWAGLVFVIAVPSAEVVTSKVLHIGSAAEAVAPVAQPAKPKPVAAVVPADKPVPAKPSQPVSTPAPASDAPVAEAASALPADPIKDYLADGKPLPDYLTTGKASAPVAAQARRRRRGDAGTQTSGGAAEAHGHRGRSQGLEIRYARRLSAAEGPAQREHKSDCRQLSVIERICCCRAGRDDSVQYGRRGEG